MSYESSLVNMLESEINGKCGRHFLSINWDTVNKQYVMGSRVYSGSNYPAVETIYIYFETITFLFQRLREVISLLNKFNNYKIMPLQYYCGIFDFVK